MRRSLNKTLSCFALTWALVGAFQPGVVAGGPTCPDAEDLYEQCPNFAQNGAEGRRYAQSDLVVDLSAAGNFTLQTQGTIRRIRWWGTYLISGAACAWFPDDFTVRIWSDANGNPLGPDPLPIPAYTVTRLTDPVGEIPAALGSPAAILEYELAFAGDGFQAQAGETYWLEVQNDYTVSGACYWVWVTAADPPGDGSSRQRSPGTDPDWSAPTNRGFDLAFSLLSGTGVPIPAVSPWALVTLIALLVGAGAIILRRRGGPECRHSHGSHSRGAMS